MLVRSSQMVELRSAVAAAQAQIAQLESERLAHLRIDRATGAHTLAAFRLAAVHDLERARRAGTPLALVLFEIDGLRALSAQHGAEIADDILKTLCGLVRQDVRDCLLGRTGPGELAVLLRGRDATAATGTASRVVAALAAADVLDLGVVTVSAGAAGAPRGIQLDVLIAAADEHLLIARECGGGTARGPVPGGDESAVRVGLGVIDALARALTQRDSYTGEHSRSVVALSQTVAVGLGLSPAEVDRVSTAALLHDIGKVAIPDAILQKPAGLDDEEWRVMREHPVIGERMLRAVPGLGGIARIVRHEHERWDGAGYPDGLTEQEIPVGSRIILACDAYHAMTSDRPYRERMPEADALDELARRAGTQFDPHVTEVLIGSFWSARQLGAA